MWIICGGVVYRGVRCVNVPMWYVICGGWVVWFAVWVWEYGREVCVDVSVRCVSVTCVVTMGM